MLDSFDCQFDIAQNQLENENLSLNNFLGHIGLWPFL